MDVSLPDWSASRAGTRIRVALWLMSEVGEHGTFTKAQLRTAFPGVEQVDRRMRDLRAEGWKISTNREDRSLDADELRLVTVGGRVWEPGYRSRQPTVSDADRARTLENDGYSCRFCGIGAGEPYPDDRVRTAKLSIERAAHNGDDTVHLRTLCDRCMAGRAGRDASVEIAALRDSVSELSATGLEEFARWARRGQRDRSATEALWSRHCALPQYARGEVARHAAAELGRLRGTAADPA